VEDLEQESKSHKPYTIWHYIEELGEELKAIWQKSVKKDGENKEKPKNEIGKIKEIFTTTAVTSDFSNLL